MFAPPIRAMRLLFEQEMRELARTKLVATILVTRSHGMLDTANKVSEWLHRWDCDQLPAVLHGFPGDPKHGET